MKRPSRRSNDELLKAVEKLFLREVLSFDGPTRVGVRLDGRQPQRSVFAVAVLESCDSVAVARVYEADLDRDPERALQIVYMSQADMELVRTIASSDMLHRPHS